MSEPALVQLEQDGLLRKERSVHRTTRRWQAAMARAALRLFHTDGARDDDLRIPIACALLEIYGPEATRERIAELTETMVAIEAAELDPRTHLTP